MIRLSRARLGLVIACAAPSCAYYNALYNANQLAERARAAENQGSPAEARSLWEQVAIKAESVTIRHPRSKYRDDALLLQGLALSELGRCRDALRPLGMAAESSPDARIVARARYELGKCHVAVGDPARASELLDFVIYGPGGNDLVPVALLWRGRAALAAGDYADAVQHFTWARSPTVGIEQAFGLAHLERWSELDSLLGTALRPGYGEVEWLAALDTLGAKHPGTARRLVDRLVARGEISVGERARLLLADGHRLEAGGKFREAADRYAAVAARAPDSSLIREAQARLALNRLRHRTGPSTSPTVILRELEAAASGGGIAAELGAPAISVLSRIVSFRPEGGRADVELFLLGELARDSLHAASLAGSLFRRVQRDYPSSAIAAKALLAAAWVEPESRGQLVDQLLSSYPNSPYASVLRGRDAAGFSEAEAFLGGGPLVQADRPDAVRRPFDPDSPRSEATSRTRARKPGPQP